MTPILPRIETPSDLGTLDNDELVQLASEIRSFIVETVTTTGGHLGSNLGVVELTLAIHRVFTSPKDAILWDTGHQAYIHKLLTGRRYGFRELRQHGGLSGYPSRAESEHDWIENSHASTALSYAHGLATAFELDGEAFGRGGDRRVVAVVGDGSLTGGMAYEALNNLGHSGRRVVIILNDNGRSYAPTISHLSCGVTTLRLHPSYVHTRERLRSIIRDLPGVGDVAYSGIHGLTSALREVLSPHTFFEALGVRYAGPIDGHDMVQMEQAFSNAATWDGPIVVHVLTQKGRGYAPAEDDEIQRLHDVGARKSRAVLDDSGDGDQRGVSVSANVDAGMPVGVAGAPDVPPLTYTDAFTRSLLRLAEANPKIVALTAAMPGPTGLLAFEERFPDRFFDVGIAEQHELTAAAGMAMGGLRPVVAVYSTFFCRAFDQANLDVGLHGLPVVLVFDRAGITGDNGPSHHGTLDLALSLSVPGMTVFAPSSADEVEVMMESALSLDGPASIRFSKSRPRPNLDGAVGKGLSGRKVREGDGSLCLLGVGRMLGACEDAADLLAEDGIEATVWDVRVVSPPDPAMLAHALTHARVVTVEDGVRFGGAGMFLVDALQAHAAHDGVAVPSTTVLGLPRRYIAQGDVDDILSELGLDAAGIAASARLGILDAQSASSGSTTSASGTSGSGTSGSSTMDSVSPGESGDGQPRLAPSDRTKSFTA